MLANILQPADLSALELHTPVSSAVILALSPNLSEASELFGTVRLLVVCALEANEESSARPRYRYLFSDPPLVGHSLSPTLPWCYTTAAVIRLASHDRMVHNAMRDLEHPWTSADRTRLVAMGMSLDAALRGAR